jgi:hypothetical protein
MMGAVSSWEGVDVEAAAEPNGADRGYRAASDRDRAAPWFVWGVWGLMLLGNLALVLRYTGPYPVSDELNLLSGSFTPQWLWQQHAEHRVPLAKLIWLGVLQLANYDFRAINAVSVLSVAVAAAAMIVAAARLRGRARYSDAFFPLAMLGFGQIQNFLWSWVLNHILPNLIACGLLLVIALRGREPKLRDTFLVAAVVVLLFLAGPIGLPYILAAAAWLGYRAILSWRSLAEPHGRRDGLITLGLAVACGAMVGLYFVGYHVKPGTAAGVPVAETGLIDSMKASLRILCVSFGPVVAPYVRPVGLAVLGLILASGVVLVRTWLGQPSERLRALGFLLCFGATGVLLLAVGRARAGLGWQWLMSGVYLNMAIPALCATYLTGILYGRPAIGESMQTTLFALSCLFFLPNFERAIGFGQDWHQSHQAIERDIKVGVPPSIIAERRYPNFGVAPPAVPFEQIAQALRSYKARGIPQFRAMASDPDYREIRLPITASALDEVVWKDGVGYSCSRAPDGASLAFSLDRAHLVYAIRLRCSYEDGPSGMADPRMVWKAGDAAESSDAGGPRVAKNGGGLLVSKLPFTMLGEWGDSARDELAQTLVFWVNSEVDRFRIHPDTKSFAFRILEIVLLVPPDDPVTGDPKP